MTKTLLETDARSMDDIFYVENGLKRHQCSKLTK